MADSETANIIQPHFGKLEERLYLKPILGKLFSKKLFNTCHLQELQSKDTRIEQNRIFLDYLLTQPVEQVKKFCQVLQEDIGNASHQELAAEILVTIPPVDPWKCMPRLLQIIANKLLKSPDSYALKKLLKQAVPADVVVEEHEATDNLFPLLSKLLDLYQTKLPQDPHMFLAHLQFLLEATACKGDVTPVRREIHRVWQSLDY